MKTKKQKGLSLVEIIVAVTILVIIAVVTIPFYLNFYYRQQLDSSSNEITQFIRKAQVESLAGKDDDSYGVHFGKFADGPYYFDYYKQLEPFIEDEASCQSDYDCFVLAPFLTICDDINLDGNNNITFDKNTADTNLPDGGWVRLGIGDSCEGMSMGGGEETCPGGICDPPDSVEINVCSIMENCPYDDLKCYDHTVPDVNDQEDDCCCESLYRWERNRDGNLLTRNGGNGVIEVGEIKDVWTSADTSGVNIFGWTTGPDNYIKIYTTGQARHQGKYDENYYALSDSIEYGGVIKVWPGAEYIWIDGLQINNTKRKDRNSNGIVFDTDETENSDVRVSNCIIRNSGDITEGLAVYTTGISFSSIVNIKVWNNIIYGDFGHGILIKSDSTSPKTKKVHLLYNNTIYGSCSYGIYHGMNNNEIEYYLINNMVQYTSHDMCTVYPLTSAPFNDCCDKGPQDYIRQAFTGTKIYSNNLSEDNSAPYSWPNESFRNRFVDFVNATNGTDADFHLTFDDTDARNKGAGLRDDPNLPVIDDIDGDKRQDPTMMGTRSNPFDIGADEYVNTDEFICSIQPGCPSSGNGTCAKNYGSGCCCGSLADWEDIEGGLDYASIPCALGDLLCADKIAVAQIEGDWSGGPDNDYVAIEGWTTGPDNYIKIYTIGQARHNGIYGGNPNAYILEAESGESAIKADEDYVKIEGLQILADNSDKFGIWARNGVVGHEFSHNIIQGQNAANSAGIYTNDGSNAKVWNNVIYNFNGTGAGGIWAIGTNLIDGMEIYNNTIVNCWDGIWNGPSNDNIIKNNLVFDCDDSYDGTAFEAAYNNAYSVTDPGSGGVDISSYAGTDIFEDYNNDDFHLLSDSPVKDMGVDLSSDQDISFSDDFEDETRQGLWDIGADEQGATGASGTGSDGCPLSTRDITTITINQLGKIDRCPKQ